MKKPLLPLILLAISVISIIIIIIALFFPGLVSSFANYFISSNKLIPDTISESSSNSDAEPKLVTSTITGYSMLPTLKSGQNVAIDLNYYNTNPIQRNDIVIVEFFTQPKPVVKRVVALGNDKISFKNGNIYINGIDNGKIRIPKNSILLRQLERNNFTIPENNYLLLADNRNTDLDSTQFGLIGKSHILGKVVLKN